MGWIVGWTFAFPYHQEDQLFTRIGVFSSGWITSGLPVIRPELLSDGRKIHRRIVLGTADDLKSLASARKAVVGLRREINLNDIRIKRESITLADLSRHFQQRELMRGDTRIAYSTRKAYEGYLRKWIEPRWGEYRLFEIRAVEVESCLKSLNRAPGTRCKIRNVMSLLFNHGRRHDLCDRNPIEWVRQSGKRRTAPDILTTREVQQLLANLRFRERT